MHKVSLLVLLCILGMVACSKMQVVAVTGAAGRTGRLVFQKLLQSPDFSPLGIVRTEKSRKELLKLGASEEQVVVADIMDPQALRRAIDAGVQGERTSSLVLCTSATPRIQKRSLVKVLLGKLLGKAWRPTFTFPNGQPREVRTRRVFPHVFLRDMRV